MRAARFAAAAVTVALSSCAGPSANDRATEPAAGFARPQADPTLLGTPPGAPAILPIEQVSVRIHRAADGRLTIVEFLSPGLPESEQIQLRMAFEAGELRPAGEGASGEESWITTLQRARGR
jgi:hypothetical protein